MAGEFLNILEASSEVLSALRGNGRDVDFHTLIPVPFEEANMTDDYIPTALALLVTGEVFSNDKHPLMKQLALDFIEDLMKNRGGFAALPSEDDFDVFATMVRWYLKHGTFRGGEFFPAYPDEWLYRNWGVNENPPFVVSSPGGVLFQTDRGVPHPIIRELAARFPNQKIEFLWASGDIGNDCGHQIHHFGRVIEVPINDPVDFALDIWPINRGEYRISPDTGLWEYCKPST